MKHSLIEKSASPLKTVHVPPLPFSFGFMPASLRCDFAGQQELQKLLYPAKRHTHQRAEKVLTYFATIEYKKSAFLVMLADQAAGRNYIAKVLRKTDTDLWRPQTETRARFASLKTMDTKLDRFAPAVNEGIAKILPSSMHGVVRLSAPIAAETTLDPSEEYLLLMNAIPRGESIPEILRREAYMVPEVVDALIDVHKASLRLPDAEQWQFGKADTLRERIAGADLTYFLKALTAFQKERPVSLPVDTIKRTIDTITAHPALDAMCEKLVSRGLIVDGHGNLWRENLQRGVYYHAVRLKRRSQAVQCIDPDTNPLFTKQSVLMEAAMLLVDLRTQLDQRETQAAVRRYLRKMKLTDDPAARTLLTVGEGHKAAVRFYNAVLGDDDFDLAEQFLKITLRTYGQAADILRHPRIVDDMAALHAGLL